MATDEQAEIAELVRDTLQAADSTPGEARRDQHPKHHGCVAAVFDVADVPEDLRIGIFARPQTFRALIRFSNGRVADDRRADAHGMAIKLLDVPGAKLVPGHETETAHDFVLVDNETFLTGDISEYRWFSHGVTRARRNVLYALFFWPQVLLWHRELLKNIPGFIGKRPSSPLTNRYFSTVPYSLGSHVVKYVARPRLLRRPAGGVDTIDGLSKALVDQLVVADAVFDFGVDVQTDPATQPVEEPSVSWSAQPKARREWLATITIPRQVVAPKSALAENLAFSPWHALEEHKPLGAINRARMPIYQAMSKHRHELNGVMPVGTSEIPSN